MVTPIEISGLSPASVANDADQTLLRQGLTDYSCTVAQLRNINIPGLANLPSSALPSDYFMINRVISSVPTNFKIPFSFVGLPATTEMWFYMSSAQITATLVNWAIVPTTGDSLLACAGGDEYTVAQNQGGSWQQPAFFVGLDNMPVHTHNLNVYRNSAGGLSNTYAVAANTTIGTVNTAPSAILPQGGSQPISLDDSWRPYASVGNICRKLA